MYVKESSERTSENSWCPISGGLLYVPGRTGVRGFQASTAPMAYKLYTFQVHELSEVLEAINTVGGCIYSGTDDNSSSSHPSVVEQQSPPAVTEFADKINQLAGKLDQLAEGVDKLAEQRIADFQQLEVVSHKLSQFEPEADSVSTVTAGIAATTLSKPPELTTTLSKP